MLPEEGGTAVEENVGDFTRLRSLSVMTLDSSPLFFFRLSFSFFASSANDWALAIPENETMTSQMRKECIFTPLFYGSRKGFSTHTSCDVRE